MRISINGKPRNVKEGLSVSDLLKELKLVPGRIAVERNRKIVPRGDWESSPVAEGDEYEIVHFVGGG